VAVLVYRRRLWVLVPITVVLLVLFVLLPSAGAPWYIGTFVVAYGMLTWRQRLVCNANGVEITVLGHAPHPVGARPGLHGGVDVAGRDPGAHSGRPGLVPGAVLLVGRATVPGRPRAAGAGQAADRPGRLITSARTASGTLERRHACAADPLTAAGGPRA
jgi:hypothetical protein